MLLHEKMRNWAWSDKSWELAMKHYGVTTFVELFDKMADELEQDYVPGPHFVSGEPVTIGSKEVDGLKYPVEQIDIIVKDTSTHYILKDEGCNETEIYGNFKKVGKQDGKPE